MTVLSFSYGIIIDRAINAPVRGTNVLDGLNTMEKCYVKEQMEMMCKLASNYTSKIGIIPIASK